MSAISSLLRARQFDAGHLVRAVAAWAAQAEVFLLAPSLGALALANSLPRKVVWLAIAWIGVLWLCRLVAWGRLSLPTAVDRPLALMLAMLPVALWASADLSMSLPILYLVVGEVAAFYGIVNWAHTGRRVRWLASAFVVAGIAIGLLALAGTNWSSGKVLSLAQVYARLPNVIIPQLNALGFSPNLVGGMVGVLIPVTVAQFLFGRGRVARLLAGAASVLLGLALVLSQSRGALIGVGLAFVVMGVLRDRRFWLVVFAAGLIAGAATYQIGLQRTVAFLSGSTSVESIHGRFEVWERAIYMIQDFPFTGIGLGTFEKVTPLLYPLFTIGPDAGVPHSHNVYLQAGVEYGLPGMVAFMGVLAALVLTGWSGVRAARTSAWHGLAIGLLGALVVFMVHGLLDAVTAVSAKTAVLVWALLGLMTATSRFLTAGDE